VREPDGALDVAAIGNSANSPTRRNCKCHSPKPSHPRSWPSRLPVPYGFSLISSASIARMTIARA